MARATVSVAQSQTQYSGPPRNSYILAFIAYMLRLFIPAMLFHHLVPEHAEHVLEEAPETQVVPPPGGNDPSPLMFSLLGLPLDVGTDG
ncbi:hypothetical protein RhiJN_20763 [Ceratobasidium sp. AG-Ba]|nr:hypothetical protein RhiJN_20763 [Ceratobasidium sp. AG-Ba]